MLATVGRQWDSRHGNDGRFAATADVQNGSACVYVRQAPLALVQLLRARSAPIIA